MEFRKVESTLSDNSKVYDVEEHRGIMWNAPSEKTADDVAQSLNNVLEAFGLCTSERQAAQLSQAIEAAIDKVLNYKERS